MRCNLVISLPTAPATPTLKELSNMLDSVVNWHALGVKLGLGDHELSTIGKDYHGDNERCKHEMLGRCLRSAKLPTWKAVADTVELMGEYAVASKIRAKHCSPSTATTDTAGTYVCLFMNLFTMWLFDMQRELYHTKKKMLLSYFCILWPYQTLSIHDHFGH